MNSIFVYGTLMKGFDNHEKFLSDYITEQKKGWMKGKLYHLPYGYPAVIEGEGIVRGEIYYLRNIEDVLPKLDWLEDFNQAGTNEMYIRLKQKVQDENNSISLCYVYFWSPKRINELLNTGVYIEDGDWRRFVT